MICLDGELGMVARNSGMHHFTDESLLGAPLAAAVDVPEYLLELNVLPNRPDFLGLIGIAREVAALLRLELRYPATYHAGRCRRVPARHRGYSRTRAMPALYVRTRPWRDGGAFTPVAEGAVASGRNATDQQCRRHHKLRPLRVGPASSCLRLPEDQRARRIVVRRMAEGETLELLSGAVVGARGQAGGKPFSQPPLVIADAERPVALAGIMGGRFAETADTTTEVLVEAAHFDPVLIRQTVQQVDLGMESRGTAASYRFERGTDPNLMLEGALGRAVHLIAEVAGGTPHGPFSIGIPSLASAGFSA